MSRHLDEVLDDCIERLLRGESVEDCLARYPQQAEELEPLLRAVARAQRALSLIPGEAARERGRRRLLQELEALEAQPARRLWAWPRRWALGLAAVALLLLLGVGTVAASGKAIPGDPLYPVRRAAERGRLLVTFSPAGRAEYHLQLALRRLEEVTALARRERPVSPSAVEAIAHQVDAALREVQRVPCGPGR